MPVTLANNLLKLADLAPFARNSNDTGVAVARKSKIGPHALAWDGLQWRGYFECVDDTADMDPAVGLQYVYPTGIMLATAPNPSGPWSFVSEVRIVDPLDLSSWERYECSPSSAIWDQAGNRWIIYFHGGNNGSGGRRIGVMYSTDGWVGRSFTRDAGNPILTVGASGASDDFGVSDLKIQAMPDGSLLGFYCGRQSGGPGNGTVHRVTGSLSAPASLTKQGEVIAEGAGGSWNNAGQYPGLWWKDPEGRIHMICAAGAEGGLGGRAGLYWSDDNGATWTQYGSNPILTNDTTAGAYDRDTGDVGQGIVDGDVLLFTTGGENTVDYATNPPLRGQHITLTPARVASPSRPAKFFLLTTGSQTQTAITSSSMLSVVTATLVARFRAFRFTRTNPNRYRHIYTEAGAFNEQVYLRIEGGSGANAGKIGAWVRTPTAWALNLFSLRTVDDGEWHEVMLRRVATDHTDLWLDGELQAADSVTTIATTASATSKAVGNWNSAAAVADEPALMSISDVVLINGAALSWADAKRVLDSRTYPSGVSATFDFPTAGTEQGNVVTVEAAARQESMQKGRRASYDMLPPALVGPPIALPASAMRDVRAWA